MKASICRRKNVVHCKYVFKGPEEIALLGGDASRMVKYILRYKMFFKDSEIAKSELRILKKSLKKIPQLVATGEIRTAIERSKTYL